MRLPAVEVKETSGRLSTRACPMVGTGKAPSKEPRFVIVAPTDHKKAWKFGSAKAHGLEPCFAFHASFLPHHRLSRGCATVKIKPTEREEAVPHSMEVLESELLGHWRDDPALAWASLVGTVGMSRFTNSCLTTGLAGDVLRSRSSPLRERRLCRTPWRSWSRSSSATGEMTQRSHGRPLLGQWECPDSRKSGICQLTISAEGGSKAATSGKS